MWNLIIHSNEITIEFSPGSQSIAAEESAGFNPSNYKYTKNVEWHVKLMKYNHKNMRFFTIVIKPT